MLMSTQWYLPVMISNQNSVGLQTSNLSMHATISTDFIPLHLINLIISSDLCAYIKSNDSRDCFHEANIMCFISIITLQLSLVLLQLFPILLRKSYSNFEYIPMCLCGFYTKFQAFILYKNVDTV
jgi:hypothetical protein